MSHYIYIKIICENEDQDEGPNYCQQKSMHHEGCSVYLDQLNQVLSIIDFIKWSSLFSVEIIS